MLHSFKPLCFIFVMSSKQTFYPWILILSLSTSSLLLLHHYHHHHHHRFLVLLTNEEKGIKQDSCVANQIDSSFSTQKVTWVLFSFLLLNALSFLSSSSSSLSWSRITTQSPLFFHHLDFFSPPLPWCSITTRAPDSLLSCWIVSYSVQTFLKHTILPLGLQVFMLSLLPLFFLLVVFFSFVAVRMLCLSKSGRS